MAAAALPSSQEDWAGMLAAAACGLPQRAADSQLLASSHAVDAPPRDNETAGEVSHLSNAMAACWFDLWSLLCTACVLCTLCD